MVWIYWVLRVYVFRLHLFFFINTDFCIIIIFFIVFPFRLIYLGSFAVGIVRVFSAQIFSTGSTQSFCTFIWHPELMGGTHTNTNIIDDWVKSFERIWALIYPTSTENKPNFLSFSSSAYVSNLCVCVWCN